MGHLDTIRELPCCACSCAGGFAHHAMGGSMVDRVGERGGRRHSDYLAIPLCYKHHQGSAGIHTVGVRWWEVAFGKQSVHIDRLGNLLNKNLWDLAQSEKDEKRSGRKWKRPKKLELLR